MPYDRTRKSLTHEVLQKARALARSGRFSTIHAVESELREVEGFAAAQRWFEDPNFRAQIAKLCQHAKQATIAGDAKRQTHPADLGTEKNGLRPEEHGPEAGGEDCPEGS